MKLGIPTAIYRTGHPVLSPDGNPGTPLVTATFLEAAMPSLTPNERVGLSNLPATFDTEPPLLTVCAFDTGHHELHCLGIAKGKMEMVIREHWTSWNLGSHAADMGTWAWNIGGGGSGEELAEVSLAGAHGTIKLQSRNATNAYTSLGKEAYALQPAAGALWFRGRIQFPALTNRRVSCGFVNDQTGSGNHMALVVYDSQVSDRLQGKLQAGGAITYVDLPFTAATGTWYEIDIVVDVSEGFAAFWVNGVGPYVGTTNLPAASAGLTPWFEVRSLANATSAAYCDKIWVDVITGADVRHPLLDPVLAPAVP